MSDAFKLKLLGRSPSNMDWYTIVQLCAKRGAFITLYHIFIIIFRKRGCETPTHYGTAPVLIRKNC